MGAPEYVTFVARKWQIFIHISNLIFEFFFDKQDDGINEIQMGKDLNDDTDVDSDDMEIGQPDQGDIDVDSDGTPTRDDTDGEDEGFAQNRGSNGWQNGNDGEDLDDSDKHNAANRQQNKRAERGPKNRKQGTNSDEGKKGSKGQNTGTRRQQLMGTSGGSRPTACIVSFGYVFIMFWASKCA